MIFKYKKFKPTQTDEVLKKMISDVMEKLTNCKDEVYDVGPVGSQNTSNLLNLKKLILDALNQATIQDKFVTEYLSKTLVGRKIMINSSKN